MPMLQGRAAEQELLRRHVSTLVRGHGSAVLLEGEPGIGKTSLLTDACERARARGCAVRAANAEELLTERPYSLVTAAFGIEPAGLADTDPGHAIADAEFVLGDRVVELAEQVCAVQPLVLAVDDVQWVDRASAGVLYQLFRLAATTPLLLVLSFRPAPRANALSQLVRNLSTAGAEHLTLTPLSAQDTEQLATDLLGAQLDDRMRKYIRSAAGNPMFVEELVRAIDRPRTEGTPELPELPASVIDAILARVGLLDGPALDVLRVASVFGTPFLLTDLALVTGRDVPALLELLREPISLGLLTEDRDTDGHYAFRHDLLREAVYQAIARPVRSALHTHAGTVLAEHGHDALTVASHLSRGAAPDDPAAIGWLLRAADETHHHAPAVAADLVNRAVDIAGSDSPRRQHLRSRLLQLQVEAGSLEEAVSLGEALLGQHPPASVEAPVRHATAEARLWQGRFAEAAQLLAPLVTGDRSGRPTPEREHLPAWYAFLQAWLALDDADPLIDRVLADTEGAEDVARYFALVADASRQMIRGRLRYAADRAAAAGDILIAMHHREETVRWLPPVKHLYAADRFDEVTMRLEHPIWQRRRHQPLRYAMLATVQYARGNWENADTAAETAGSVAEQLDSTWGSRGETAWIRGLIALGRGKFTDAAKVVAGTDPSDIAARGVAAQLAYARGQERVVREMVAATRNQLSAEPQSRHLVRDAWGTWLPVILALGERDTAEEIATVLSGLAETAEVPSAVAGGLFARGLVDDDADALVAAVEAYLPTPRRLELTHCREAAGTALARCGHCKDAIGYLRAAAESYVTFGASRHFARVGSALRELGVHRGPRGPRRRPDSGWQSLTPTEHAVADLVADGLVYREIAERLFVSRRTVETHVMHMFAKLGVNSRRGIAELVRIHAR